MSAYRYVSPSEDYENDKRAKEEARIKAERAEGEARIAEENKQIDSVKNEIELQGVDNWANEIQKYYEKGYENDYAKFNGSYDNFKNMFVKSTFGHQICYAPLDYLEKLIYRDAKLYTVIQHHETWEYDDAPTLYIYGNNRQETVPFIEDWYALNDIIRGIRTDARIVISKEDFLRSIDLISQEVANSDDGRYKQYLSLSELCELVSNNDASSMILRGIYNTPLTANDSGFWWYEYVRPKLFRHPKTPVDILKCLANENLNPYMLRDIYVHPNATPELRSYILNQKQIQHLGEESSGGGEDSKGEYRIVTTGQVIRKRHLYYIQRGKWLPQETVKVYIKTSKSSSCFIATVCYGSAYAEEVNRFREYRDEHLVNSWFGRIFISCYYFMSPPVAKMVAKREWMKKTIRKYMLSPILKRLPPQKPKGGNI